MHFCPKQIVLAGAITITIASVAASPVHIQRDLTGDVIVGTEGINVDVDLGGPAAQAVLVPTVKRSGNNYTWEFTDMSAKSTGPFGIIHDSWGTRAPNLNRLWTTDPINPKSVVMRVNYPNGTTTPSAKSNPPNTVGGVGFYAQPISPSILSKAKSVEFEYSVYFPCDFVFGRGGKLPGLYGGDGRRKGCSGGNDGDSCFSLRFMWRRQGAGEAYIYRPQSAVMDPKYCTVPPFSFCNADYGDSIGRGSFYFKPGTWTKVKQEIVVNAVPGARTGTIKVWADDKLVIDFPRMVWRISPIVTVQGIVFQTFFGGSTPDWATPKDQYTLYKGFKMTAVV